VRRQARGQAKVGQAAVPEWDYALTSLSKTVLNFSGGVRLGSLR
jgi:hypothetical protein